MPDKPATQLVFFGSNSRNVHIPMSTIRLLPFTMKIEEVTIRNEVSIMKAPEEHEKLFIVRTDVLDSSKETDFVIEIFPYSTDMNCDGLPIKTIHNFDELIEFFEEEV